MSTGIEGDTAIWQPAKRVTQQKLIHCYNITCLCKRLSCSPILNLYFARKHFAMGWWDRSSGKGLCHQDWGSQFNLKGCKAITKPNKLSVSMSVSGCIHTHMENKRQTDRHMHTVMMETYNKKFINIRCLKTKLENHPLILPHISEFYHLSESCSLEYLPLIFKFLFVYMSVFISLCRYLCTYSSEEKLRCHILEHHSFPLR